MARPDRENFLTADRTSTRCRCEAGRNTHPQLAVTAVAGEVYLVIRETIGPELRGAGFRVRQH